VNVKTIEFSMTEQSVVDGETLARAQAQGLDPAAALANNDAYTFFEALDDLIVTGPTNTNVNDLWLGLVGRAQAAAGILPAGALR
jgi:glycerate-2-kinase